MDQKAHLKNYFIGILITIGFYHVSILIGSIFNVLISFTAGYRIWSEFVLSYHGIAGYLAMLIFGIVNHVLIAWLTVRVMTKYGKKKDCITKWFFRSSAISVVAFAVIIVPLIFAKKPGWLMYLSHALSILLFGRKKVKEYDTMKQQAESAVVQSETTDSSSAIGSSVLCDNRINSSGVYCYKCGTLLEKSSKFCYKCGAKVEN